MNTLTKRSKSFVHLRHAAARLGVSQAWLRAEADAGRVPFLQAGRSRLFNVEEVERVLLERGATEEGGKS